MNNLINGKILTEEERVYYYLTNTNDPNGRNDSSSLVRSVHYKNFPNDSSCKKDRSSVVRLIWYTRNPHDPDALLDPSNVIRIHYYLNNPNVELSPSEKDTKVILIYNVYNFKDAHEYSKCFLSGNKYDIYPGDPLSFIADIFYSRDGKKVSKTSDLWVSRLHYYITHPEDDDCKKDPCDLIRIFYYFNRIDVDAKTDPCDCIRGLYYLNNYKDRDAKVDPCWIIRYNYFNSNPRDPDAGDDANPIIRYIYFRRNNFDKRMKNDKDGLIKSFYKYMCEDKINEHEKCDKGLYS